MRKIIIIGIVMQVLFFVLLFLGDLSKNVSWFLVVNTLLFLLYGYAYFSIKGNKKKLLVVIVVFAVLFRLVMLFTAPTLSDDIYRYMWDGKIQANGINPYLHAPNSQEVASFANEIHLLINHPSVPTIYPPVSQWFFLLGYLIFKTVFGFKLLFVLVDLGVLWLLIKILRRERKNVNLSLLYAWSPLVVIEIAGSGHYTIIPIFFLVLSLYYYKQKVKFVFSYAATILAGLLPLFLFPIFWMKHKLRLLWIFPVIALVYFPYFVGREVFNGLGAYSKSWEFNGFLYKPLKLLLTGFVADPSFVARVSLVLVFIVFVFYLAWKRTEVVGAVQYSFLAYLLVNPVLNPWYVLWLVPLLVMRFSWAMLYLTFSVSLSYVVFLQSGWFVPWWVMLIEFIPVVVLPWFERKKL